MAIIKLLMGRICFHWINSLESLSSDSFILMVGWEIQEPPLKKGMLKKGSEPSWRKVWLTPPNVLPRPWAIFANGIMQGMMNISCDFKTGNNKWGWSSSFSFYSSGKVRMPILEELFLDRKYLLFESGGSYWCTQWTLWILHHLDMPSRDEVLISLAARRVS